MLPEANYLMLPWPSTTDSSIGALANAVNLVRVYVPSSITVSLIGFSIVTPEAGKHWSIGLYDLDGNLVMTSGVVTMAASPGSNQYVSSSFTAVSVGSGVYWMAYTSDSNVSSLRAIDLASDAAALLRDTLSTTGTAANASSLGVLPATIGAITPTTPGQDISPLIKFQA